MEKYDVAVSACVMDMLHEGHINLLKKMAEKADKIILFVHDDKSTFQNKGRFPVQSLDHRMVNLSSLSHSKEVPVEIEVLSVLDANPGDLMDVYIREEQSAGKTVVYIRGNDWLEFPGKEVIESLEVPIEYVQYTKGVSSTSLRNSIRKLWKR